MNPLLNDDWSLVILFPAPVPDIARPIEEVVKSFTKADCRLLSRGAPFTQGIDSWTRSSQMLTLWRSASICLSVSRLFLLPCIVFTWGVIIVMLLQGDFLCALRSRP